MASASTPTATTRQSEADLPSDGNRIVASQAAAIQLEGSSAGVERNAINAITGQPATGNAIGIRNAGAVDTLIEGNVIAGSTTGDGVVIGGGSTNVDVLENAISGNAGLGIDVGDDGVTPNEPEGPIYHENFPQLTDTTVGPGGTVRVVGQFRARGGGSDVWIQRGLPVRHLPQRHLRRERERRGRPVSRDPGRDDQHRRLRRPRVRPPGRDDGRPDGDRDAARGGGSAGDLRVLGSAS